MELLMKIATIASIIAFALLTRGLASLSARIVAVLLSAGAALYGARAFHSLLESQDGAPGSSFYGALFGGALVFAIANRVLFREGTRGRSWDAVTLCLPFVCALLRVGCFLEGCCWGRISGAPWAVQYFDPHSVMPYMGIPVHPVQLYDAIACFGIGLILTKLWKMRIASLDGRLWAIFGALYGLERSITESFRGTGAYSPLKLGAGIELSISQGVSIALALGMSCFIIYVVAASSNAPLISSRRQNA